MLVSAYATQSIPLRLNESSSYEELTLLLEWKKRLIDEIMTMENTSTEAMVVIIYLVFFLQILGVKYNLSCVYTKRNVFASVKLLHVGKGTENTTDLPLVRKDFAVIWRH